MKALLNRQVLEQTSWDSSSPSGLASVVYKLEEPGDYQITMLRDEKSIRRFQLRVTEAAAERELSPLQVQIDLAGSRKPALAHQESEAEEHLTVASGGHVVFNAPAGERDYTLVVEKTEKDGQRRTFDSRTLGTEDTFAVTLLRPGTYSVTNAQTQARGRITVVYPTVGKAPYRPPDPVNVDCTKEGFKPDTIELQPAQGIIFHSSTPSRIKIELVEPDDGPAARGAELEGERRPRAVRARWKKQSQ